MRKDYWGRQPDGQILFSLTIGTEIIHQISKQESAIKPAALLEDPKSNVGGRGVPSTKYE
jgi:hypothetical protein